MDNSFKMTRKELNKCRNKAELPLYIVCVTINLFIIFAVIVSFVYYRDMSLGFYIAFLYLFINLFLSLGGTFSSARLYAVEINEYQFSEIYMIAKAYADRLGLRKMPKIYVKQNGGMLNAFAAYFLFRNYVLINADIFEIAYNKNKDIKAVSFILAHEMAHIAYWHTRFWYNSSILLCKYIPFLYPALSRAMEYSCDNVAKKLCPDGMYGMFVLLVGKHLYDKVNVEEYIKQADKTFGWFEFYKNARATHPVPVRRIMALYDIDRQRIIW